MHRVFACLPIIPWPSREGLTSGAAAVRAVASSVDAAAASAVEDMRPGAAAADEAQSEVWIPATRQQVTP